jgi:hypothetical protein
MRTFGLLAAATAVVGLAATAGANPLAGSVMKRLTLTDIGLVEPVHGCHGEVLADRYGWHYHRRNCRRVDVPPPEAGPYGPYPYEPYEYYEPRPCFWVGPMRVCP